MKPQRGRADAQGAGHPVGDSVAEPRELDQIATYAGLFPDPH